MREFRVRAGKFQGDYNIYESRKEFFETFPDVKIKKWPVDAPFEVNDWIEAEDGYILQLLQISRPFMKRDEERNKVTKLYHFCNASIKYIKSSKQREYYYKFYGMLAGKDRYTLSDNPFKIRGKLDKKLFVSLILNNVSMYQAFRIAFRTKQKIISTDRLFHALADIIKDKEVMTEFNNQLTPFQTKLNDELTDEEMASILAKLVKSPDKFGSKQHLDSFTLAAKFKGIDTSINLPQLPSPDKQLGEKNVEDADYNEIPNTEPPNDK